MAKRSKIGTSADTALGYFARKFPAWTPGPLFTKKTPSSGYRNHRYKPMTAWWPSRMDNGNSFTNITSSSKWIEAEECWWAMLHMVVTSWLIRFRHWLNSSLPGHNGRYFTDDIFRSIFVNDFFLFWLNFNWGFFLSVKLTITQHRFR